MRQLFLVMGFALLASCQATKKTGASSPRTPQTDSTKDAAMSGAPGSRKAATGPAAAPKAFKEVITSKAVSQKGLFSVHKVDDKYYYEIPDGLLGKDILTVNRLSRAAAGLRTGGSGYAGDQINQNVIRFEKGPGNKIFIRSISFEEFAPDSTSEMFNNLMNSNIQPIVASFDIKAWSRDTTGSVIDVTDFLLGDNEVVGFQPRVKQAFRLGNIQADKSYISTIRSYPINVESKAVKTYSRTPASATAGTWGDNSTGNVTVEINTSMVVLPEKPMQSRYYDNRVGYFTVGYTDYDLDPQGVKKVQMIKRWRLEPKPEDMEKYKAGQLVEPQKPIVFYIDPSTPKKWVPYLIQGVNDWQAAFEKAGFKNAIMAKEAPTYEQDSTWSLDDARNSAIVYKPSDIPNASGPSISDPRTGEIMESHINWYHNVMSLLRNWYMIQASPTDTRARQMTFEDSLMGQLIRFVSSHEVGHTIGLRHNYGSSSTVPVDSLRNKAWVEANGHTPSIMDYARFNYVAQPEDNVSESGLFPRIGDYDEWAIEWGYRLFPQFKSAEAEKNHINKWVMEKAKNKRLWFGRENNSDDPRSQNEDLGDNSMKASMYGIKNLQRIIPNLNTWTRVNDQQYEDLGIMYDQVVTQYQRYMGHVSKHIGGITETYKTVEQNGPVYEFVPAARQREAINFLRDNLFNTPRWLINQSILDKTGSNALTVVGGVQDNVLRRLITDRVFGNFTKAEAFGSQQYTASSMISDLGSAILTEVRSGANTDVFRRRLQKSYVDMLTDYIKPSSATPISLPGLVVRVDDGKSKSDAVSAIRTYLVQLRPQLTAAANRSANAETKSHFSDLAFRIERALNPNN